MSYLFFQISWQTIELPFGNERLINLLWCIGIIAGTLLLKKPMTWVLTKFSTAIAHRFTEKNHGVIFSALLRKPLELLLQTVLFYIALNQLNILLNHFVLQRYKGKNDMLAIRFGDVVDMLFVFFAILFSTLLLSRIIDFVYRVQQDKAQEEQNRERQQLLPLLKDVAKLVLWTIGIFWILGSVFRVNIPALITGLGIGGVAIALAAKESIENLFAAFTILSDKPFQTGDLIKLGSLEGNVERIGFRSTRLRSPDGAALVIPNKKLVMENLENVTQRSHRRIKIVVNVKYGISHPDLEKMIAELKEAIIKTTHVKQPVEILLEGFAENVFQLSISYRLPVLFEDGSNLNNIKQEINMLTYSLIDKYTGVIVTGDTTTKNSNIVDTDTETDTSTEED